MKKPKRRREVREAGEISRRMASPKGQKVFICWSGDRSKRLAEAIYWWLPHVLQFAKPYFSPEDIGKGRPCANYVKSSKVWLFPVDPVGYSPRTPMPWLAQ